MTKKTALFLGSVVHITPNIIYLFHTFYYIFFFFLKKYYILFLNEMMILIKMSKKKLQRLCRVEWGQMGDEDWLVDKLSKKTKLKFENRNKSA